MVVRYGKVVMQTFFHPIFDSVTITLTNNETCKEYLRIDVRGMKEGQEILELFDSFLLGHECSTCAAKRILTLVDIPDELRERIKVLV